MSAKFKFVSLVILSTLCTVAIGIYFWQRYPSAPLAANNNSNKSSHFTFVSSSRNSLENPERLNYKSIPIERIDSVLQGTDPTALAVDILDTIESKPGQRKIEVAYPQANQALVTITQTQQINKTRKAIKYRMEMTSFGRTLLVNSPPMWKIVWAGYQSKAACPDCDKPNFNSSP